MQLTRTHDVKLGFVNRNNVIEVDDAFEIKHTKKKEKNLIVSKSWRCNRIFQQYQKVTVFFCYHLLDLN